MRDHIRREAMGSTTAYWLVPIAFAAAALAAVAIIDPAMPSDTRQAVQPTEAAPADPRVQPVVAPASQPADGMMQVGDHVQAF